MYTTPDVKLLVSSLSKVIGFASNETLSSAGCCVLQLSSGTSIQLLEKLTVSNIVLHLDDQKDIFSIVHRHNVHV